MKYLRRFNEELTELEMNNLLDKISSIGMDKLSKDEIDKLNSFNGKYDKDGDTLSFDKDGNMLVNGKLYSQKNSNVSNANLDKFTDDEFYTIFEDSSVKVVLSKKMGDTKTYYIIFKGIEEYNSINTLKLIYGIYNDDFTNYVIYDDKDRVTSLEDIETDLNELGLNFTVFNDPWSYIEDDFNN